MVIRSGTVTLRNTTIDKMAIQLAGTESAPPTLDISNVTLAAGTTLKTANFYYDARQYLFAGTLRASGLNKNLGTISAESNDSQRLAHLTIDIASGGGATPRAGQFVNAGTISTNRMGEVTIRAASPGATFQNNGLVSVAGHATIDATLTGTGTIRLEAAGPSHGFIATPDVTTTGAVGWNQHIQVLGGDKLRIGDLPDFLGVIEGFSGVPVYNAIDRIDLLGHEITGMRWQAGTGGGTLTLLEGDTVAGNLRFAGSYSADSFVLNQVMIGTPTGVVGATEITMRAA